MWWIGLFQSKVNVISEGLRFKNLLGSLWVCKRTNLGCPPPNKDSQYSPPTSPPLTKFLNEALFSLTAANGTVLPMVPAGWIWGERRQEQREWTAGWRVQEWGRRSQEGGWEEVEGTGAQLVRQLNHLSVTSQMAIACMHRWRGYFTNLSLENNLTFWLNAPVVISAKVK